MKKTVEQLHAEIMPLTIPESSVKELVDIISSGIKKPGTTYRSRVEYGRKVALKEQARIALELRFIMSGD